MNNTHINKTHVYKNVITIDTFFFYKRNNELKKKKKTLNAYTYTHTCAHSVT